MIKENAEKVKSMDKSVLETLFKDWEQTHQLDPFDIVIYNRYQEPCAIIRRIDAECGALASLAHYCTISTREELDSEVEILNYLDPEGGPVIAPGIYEHENTHTLIYEIYYIKKKGYVVFYDMYADDQKIDADTLDAMHKKLKKIIQDTK